MADLLTERERDDSLSRWQVACPRCDVILYGPSPNAVIPRLVDHALEAHPGGAPDQVWVTKELYDAVWRAYEMTIEALDVLAMDGPGEPSNETVKGMCRIVARSARSLIPDARPNR